jgi:hypothetical protein
VLVSIVPDPCGLCGSPDAITGDGAPRCAPCVAALTRIAADPRSTDPRVLRRLEDRSLDVVRLTGGRWVWTALWPGVEGAP